MTSLFERIKSAIPSGGLPIASYAVLKRNEEKEYEERLYPVQTWVQTQYRHASREDCNYHMFWKLFNYISGQNERQLTIPMTAPVSVLVEPIMACDDGEQQQQQTPDRQQQYLFTMAFYIPAPYDEDPPRPNDPSVRIERRPELRVIVRTYGGFTNDRIDAEERERLAASLTDDDRRTVQLCRTDDSYYCAGYDPPLKLFFRRNEIWLPITPAERSSNDPASPCQ